jgi:hypothetical protein
MAHLVVPVSAWFLTSIVVGAALLGTGLITPPALVWALSTGVLLAGAHLMAAFRGLPPAGMFGPQAGPPAMIFWYAKPVMAALIVGTATAAWAARADSLWNPLSWLLIVGALVGAWGRALVDKQDRRGTSRFNPDPP